MIAIVIRLFHSSDADPDFATQLLCHEHPGIEDKYGREYIREMIAEVAESEDALKSAEFQSLFREFNLAYFGGRLPQYKVRVVFHIQHFVPEATGSLGGFHSVKTRTIYLRVKDDTEMRAILVHEMAHGAIGGAHDDRFWAEMARLHAAGAPVGHGDLEW